MDRKKFLVTIPIVGTCTVEVEARDEEEAETLAFDKMSDEDAEVEWEGMSSIVDGNVFHGRVNRLHVEEIS